MNANHLNLLKNARHDYDSVNLANSTEERRLQIKPLNLERSQRTLCRQKEHEKINFYMQHESHGMPHDAKLPGLVGDNQLSENYLDRTRHLKSNYSERSTQATTLPCIQRVRKISHNIFTLPDEINLEAKTKEGSSHCPTQR